MSPYVENFISYEGHLFFQNVKNLIQISEMQKKKKKRKKVSLSEIIASEDVAINCLY